MNAGMTHLNLSEWSESPHSNEPTQLRNILHGKIDPTRRGERGGIYINIKGGLEYVGEGYIINMVGGF